MEKVWKNIEGYEGYYQISNLGNVKSLERYDKRGVLRKEQELKTALNSFGRSIVVLNKDGKQKTHFVSRIVAKAFPEICGEWFEGCQVHHKDGNPLNNNASNLIVVSHNKHWNIHREEGIKHPSKPVFQYDYDWNFIRQYDSIETAANSVKGVYDCLRNAIHSENHFYKGYRWLYAS